MEKFVAIIDYGLGNLKSVSKALEAVGARVKLTDKQENIIRASAIVLPGVGAFKRAMDNLKKLEILPSIIDSIKKGKPFLGICLGLQVLFTESQEHGRCEGLDVLKGKVKRFAPGVKIPHMGWNSIKFKVQSSKLKVFKDIPEESYFYFVHSYYVEPEDERVVVATTEYGGEFVCAVNKDNVWGLQFHPEKSQNLGLKILDNFLGTVS